MLLTTKDLQQALHNKSLYNDEIDGIAGRNTIEAVHRLLIANKIDFAHWDEERDRVAAEQIIMRDSGIEVGRIDGFMGPQTRSAFQEYIKLDRDKTAIGDDEPPHISHEVNTASPAWPRQVDVPKFYGEMGQNQVMLPLPYPMKIAWDMKTIVNRISIHRKCAESALIVLKQVLEHYGHDEIVNMGLDLYGGSLNVRKMRGSNAWSMHSWGIAIDIDPDHNDLHTPFLKARFGRPEYQGWWDAWHGQNWICLGPDRNYDTMHSQAARL